MRRIPDVLAAGLGLLILSPLLLLLAAMVLLESRGGAFYRAERVGRHGKRFTLYKFRTMIARGGDRADPLTRAGDERVTRVGRYLRLYKLDELPQLLNVLKGDMNLVGPRPEDPQFVQRYSPDERRILDMRPGITSPASLAFRHEERFLRGPDPERMYVEDIMPRKIAIDLAYFSTRTFADDVRIVGRTVRALFS